MEDYAQAVHEKICDDFRKATVIVCAVAGGIVAAAAAFYASTHVPGAAQIVAYGSLAGAGLGALVASALRRRGSRLNHYARCTAIGATGWVGGGAMMGTWIGYTISDALEGPVRNWAERVAPSAPAPRG